MPLYTLEWKKERGPEGSNKEVFIAKSDAHAFVHAAAATCITMENGMPNLRDFLDAGAKELRRGDEAIFPPTAAKIQDSKRLHVVLAYVRRK